MVRFSVLRKVTQPHVSGQAMTADCTLQQAYARRTGARNCGQVLDALEAWKVALQLVATKATERLSD